MCAYVHISDLIHNINQQTLSPSGLYATLNVIINVHNIKSNFSVSRSNKKVKVTRSNLLVPTARSYQNKSLM
jgi:hypothetical protein